MSGSYYHHPLRYCIPKRVSSQEKSFEKLKKQFSEAASQVEASGWCLLVWTNRLERLNILQCEKHQNLTLWGCTPILVIDMWEHSYYLQYKTKRPEYIDAFWNIVNWNEANKRFNQIKSDK